MNLCYSVEYTGTAAIKTAALYADEDHAIEDTTPFIQQIKAINGPGFSPPVWLYPSVTPLISEELLLTYTGVSEKSIWPPLKALF